MSPLSVRKAEKIPSKEEVKWRNALRSNMELANRSIDSISSQGKDEKLSFTNELKKPLLRINVALQKLRKDQEKLKSSLPDLKNSVMEQISHEWHRDGTPPLKTYESLKPDKKEKNPYFLPQKSSLKKTPLYR